MAQNPHEPTHQELLRQNAQLKERAAEMERQAARNAYVQAERMARVLRFKEAIELLESIRPDVMDTREAIRRTRELHRRVAERHRARARVNLIIAALAALMVGIVFLVFVLR